MKNRIIASLTSIPSRVNDDCKKTIDSIIDQVDKIYLKLSNNYFRLKETIDCKPEFLNDSKYSKVEVIWVPDLGPINKFLSIPEEEKDSWIFVCDDDQEYQIDLIEKMFDTVKHNQYKRGFYQNWADLLAVYGEGGIIHGYTGMMADYESVKGIEKFPLPEAGMWEDDILVSIYCEFNKIPIYSSGVEDLNGIFKVLENNFAKIGPDALASVGNRYQKISELEKYFKIKMEKGGKVQKLQQMYYINPEESFIEMDSKGLFYPNDKHISLNIHYYGYLESNVINWCIDNFKNTNKVFLDIGANVGAWSCLLSPYFKHVYSFEPGPEVHNYLCANIALKGLSYNITPFRYGLSCENKIMKYYRRSLDSGLNGFTLLHDNNDAVDIEVKTLDSFNIKNIGFIKLDVEGHELEVIKGSLKTLEENDYPNIIFESWSPDKSDIHKKLRKDLFLFIVSIGYRIIPISGVEEMFVAVKDKK